MTLPVPPAAGSSRQEHVAYALAVQRLVMQAVNDKSADAAAVQLALGLAQLHATLAVYLSLEGGRL